MKKYFHKKNILSFLLFFLVCLFILSVDVRAGEYIGKHTKIYAADMGKNIALSPLPCISRSGTHYDMYILFPFC